MRLFLSFFLLAVSLATAPLAADPATAPDPDLATVDPVDPADALRSSLAAVDPTTDPAWHALFDQLGTPKTRLSAFTEARYFPFRRTPVILQGEIRIIPDRGLSLRYLEPKEQLLIVDDQGVLMRDEKGRQRRAPTDSRATAASSALTTILRFDLAGLTRDFSLRGARSGSTWILEFAPLDSSLAHQLGTITVEGDNTRLAHIEMRKSDQQRIEITIGETTEDVTFTPTEIARFFR